jgi:hypothetical protein
MPMPREVGVSGRGYGSIFRRVARWTAQESILEYMTSMSDRSRVNDDIPSDKEMNKLEKAKEDSLMTRIEERGTLRE